MDDVKDGTIEDFIQRHKLTMTAERASKNPHMPDSDHMDHWRVTITDGRHRLSTYFSMGIGHRGAEPALSDVLDCLASDASSSGEDFGEWCRAYGYDKDSRKAEHTYRVVKTQTARLNKFLGDEAFEELVYHTTR